MIRTILEFRNAVEYQDYQLSEAEQIAVLAVWHAIVAWAHSNGLRLD